jgi:ClpX C4-type zinc finger
LRLMFAAAAVLEELARSAPHGGAARAASPPSLRACSFCGKTEAETKLAAGPVANICGPCTRLLCGVLGVALSDEPRDDDAPSSPP